METLFIEHVKNIGVLQLFLYFIVCLFFLAKAADYLIENAVKLSHKARLPKIIIGATIVSLGTTLPEVSVSVLAAIEGFPGLALGNAVGSIICDTGLILGLACIIRPINFDKKLLTRQSWIQWGCGVLLIVFSIPWLSLSQTFKQGGYVSQAEGIFLVIGLLCYILFSIKTSLNKVSNSDTAIYIKEQTYFIIIKIIIFSIIVIVCSKALIIVATELAYRLSLPQSIIAATLVAFGTSLPELVTALTASFKKHGDLALGNIIGADILNVLSVTGISAAVTKEGLKVDPYFFIFLFPAMFVILTFFRLWLLYANKLNRLLGVILVTIYILIITISFYYNVQLK